MNTELMIASLDDEIEAVQKEVERLKPAIYLPRVFLKLAVEVVKALRSDMGFEIGLETGIHAGITGKTLALLQGRCIVSLLNIKKGTDKAITEKINSEDKTYIKSRIAHVFPEVSLYVKRELNGIDLSKIVRPYHELWGADSEWTAIKLKQIITGSEPVKQLEDLAGLIYKNEAIHKFRIYEVMAEYLDAYERGRAKSIKSRSPQRQ